MSNDLMNRNSNWMDFGNDDLFDQFASRFFGSSMGNRMNFQEFNNLPSMQTDIAETDEAYTLTIDLPGLKKENIVVDYSDDILSVGGRQEQENEALDNTGDVIHSERYYGSYSRQYRLPNIDREKTSATYEDGILKLYLPKQTDSGSGRRIEIQ